MNDDDFWSGKSFTEKNLSTKESIKIACKALSTAFFVGFISLNFPLDIAKSVIMYFKANGEIQFVLQVFR